MGAVHGVHLKYVGLSLASAGCASRLHVGGVHTSWFEGLAAPKGSLWCAAMLYGCAAVHMFVATLFIRRQGMWLIGKKPMSGQIPLWSYCLWSAFHIPTTIYTRVHAAHDARKGVPPASEVCPGWWIGGCYAHKLKRKWAVTIDLTVEFPERCIGTTAHYLNLPCWDGQPPKVEEIEAAAQLAARYRNEGDVLVHCAHGRGRSTCVMVACLVRAGLFSSWEAAFEASKQQRRCIKLNAKMRRALTEWQQIYGTQPYSSVSSRL